MMQSFAEEVHDPFDWPSRKQVSALLLENKRNGKIFHLRGGPCGDVVGYVTCLLFPYRLAGGFVRFIDELFVDAAARRHRCGALVLEALRQRDADAGDVKAHLLEVGVEKLRLQECYTSRGFAVLPCRWWTRRCPSEGSFSGHARLPAEAKSRHDENVYALLFSAELGGIVAVMEHASGEIEDAAAQL